MSLTPLPEEGVEVRIRMAIANGFTCATVDADGTCHAWSVDQRDIHYNRKSGEHESCPGDPHRLSLGPADSVGLPIAPRKWRLW